MGKVVGGMQGHENHMHSPEAHHAREGGKPGSFGVGSHHVSPNTHVANNHSGHHDNKKAAGYNQRSGHASDAKAMADSKVHAGHSPNNK